jgi:hypothetical protein
VAAGSDSSFPVEIDGWSQLLDTMRRAQQEGQNVGNTFVAAFERSSKAAEAQAAAVRELSAATKQIAADAASERAQVAAARTAEKEATEAKRAAARQVREEEKAAAAAARKEAQDVAAAQKAAAKEAAAAERQALDEAQKAFHDRMEARKQEAKAAADAQKQAAKDALVAELGTKGFQGVADERAANFSDADKARAAAGGLTAQQQALKDLQAEARKAGVYVKSNLTEQLGELEKALGKGFGFAVAGSISSHLGGAFQSVGTEATKMTGLALSGAGQVATAFGAGGPPAAALATFAVGVEFLAHSWQEEAEASKKASEDAARAMEARLQQAKSFRQSLNDIVAQERALAIQDESRVSSARAVAAAKVEEAEKTNKAKEAALAQVKADHDRAEAAKTAAEKTLDTVLGGRGAGNIRNEAQAAVDKAQAQLKDLQPKVTAATEEARKAAQDLETATKQAGATTATESHAGLEAQRLSLAKATEAARALAFQRSAGVPSTQAAIQAEREYLAAYEKTSKLYPKEQLDPALSDANVRDQRRAVLVVEEQTAASQELFTAETGLRKARIDSAIAQAALTLQSREGVPATIASAQASLAYFEANQKNLKLFPEFHTAKLRDIEDDRRRQAVTDAVRQAYSQASLTADEALRQQEKRQLAVNIATRDHVSDARASAQADIEWWKANADRLLQSMDAETYMKNALLLERNLRMVLNAEDRADEEKTRQARLNSMTDVAAKSRELATEEKVLAEMARTGKSEDEARRVVTLKLAEAELSRLKVLAQLVALNGTKEQQDAANDVLARAQADVENKKTEDDQDKIKAGLAKDAAQRAALGGLFGDSAGFAEKLGILDRATDGTYRLAEGAGVAGGAFLALGQTAEFVGQQIVEGLNQQISLYANYSRAQDDLAKMQGVTAAEQKAADEKMKQSRLAAISEMAVTEAAKQVAQGIGSLAEYQWDAAALHFGAAAAWGLIAGGTAASAHSIGESRGNTHDENQALDSARSQGFGGGSSRGGGGAGGGDGTVNVNVYTGQNILATRTEIERDIKKAYDEARRRA